MPGVEKSIWFVVLEIISYDVCGVGIDGGERVNCCGDDKGKSSGNSDDSCNGDCTDLVFVIVIVVGEVLLLMVMATVVLKGGDSVAVVVVLGVVRQ